MLSEKLSQLRAQKKLTQQQMADMLDITRPAYTAYESGTRKPEYETLEKIADIFQVSIDFLLGRSLGQQIHQIVGNTNIAFLDGNEEKLTEEEAKYLKISLEVFRKYTESKNNQTKGSH